MEFRLGEIRRRAGKRTQHHALHTRILRRSLSEPALRPVRGGARRCVSAAGRWSRAGSTGPEDGKERGHLPLRPGCEVVENLSRAVAEVHPRTHGQRNQPTGSDSHNTPRSLFEAFAFVSLMALASLTKRCVAKTRPRRDAKSCLVLPTFVHAAICSSVADKKRLLSSAMSVIEGLFLVTAAKRGRVFKNTQALKARNAFRNVAPSAEPAYLPWRRRRCRKIGGQRVESVDRFMLAHGIGARREAANFNWCRVPKAPVASVFSRSLPALIC